MDMRYVCEGKFVSYGNLLNAFKYSFGRAKLGQNLMLQKLDYFMYFFIIFLNFTKA